MNNKYLNIYNNLIKLTRNKNIFLKLSKQDTFSDRLIILLIHFSFFLQVYKKENSKRELQKMHDFFFRQLELSVREIGYGDVTINKKMKDYINLFYFIIEKLNNWNDFNSQNKREILSDLLNIENNIDYFIDYFDKYLNYLKNNTFNYFTKDVIKLEF